MREGELVKTWEAYLTTFKWDWFATLTFKGNVVGPELADRRFRRWRSDLCTSFAGDKWRERPAQIPYHVRALEWQKRGVIHFHALVGYRTDAMRDNLFRRRWQDAWRDLNGYARIDRIRDVGAVSRYCAKYCSKGGELDLSSNIPHELPPYDWTLCAPESDDRCSPSRRDTCE